MIGDVEAFLDDALQIDPTPGSIRNSGYRIANWFRAATHSLTALPVFSKLRIAR